MRAGLILLYLRDGELIKFEIHVNAIIVLLVEGDADFFVDVSARLHRKNVERRSLLGLFDSENCRLGPESCYLLSLSLAVLEAGNVSIDLFFVRELYCKRLISYAGVFEEA